MRSLKSSWAAEWMGTFGFLFVLFPNHCQWPQPGGHDGDGAIDAGHDSVDAQLDEADVFDHETSTDGQTDGGGPSATLDPVLGCAPGAWPDHARFELLPLREAGPFASIDVSIAERVSADGRVVVGNSVVHDAAHPAVEIAVPTIWTESGVLVFDQFTYGRFTSVDCAGSVAAGEVLTTLPGYEDTRLMWWSAALGPRPLPAPRTGGEVLDISADGSWILGEGVRWGPARALERTPSERAWWSAMTADGQTLFGPTAPNCPNYCLQEVYRWDEARGDTWLADSNGYVVASSDGTTVASAPFKESPEGMHDFDDVQITYEPGQTERVTCPITPCFPKALSSRGSVLLTQGSTPLVWTRKHGFRELVVLLREHGANTEQYFLDVRSMSDDARVFVGQAYEYATDRYFAYRATLPRAAWE